MIMPGFNNKEPLEEELLPRLSTWETIGGWIMLPVYLVLAGLLTMGINLVVYSLMGTQLGETATFLIPYYLCFALCVLIFRHHLARELRIFVKRFWRSVRVGATSFVIILALSYGVAILFKAIGVDIANPNQEMILESLKTNRRAIIIGACLLAPLIEEVIFRSTIYGSIARRSKLIAHIANWICFSAVHVAYYAISSRDASLLIFAVNYLPHSIGLAYAYEKSKSVWTSIFMHIIINIVSVSVMGTL